MNYYISTLYYYIPETSPFNWLKPPLELLRSLINTLLSFLNPAPQKSSKSEQKKTPSLDLFSRPTLKTIFNETKKVIDQGFYLLPNKTKVTFDLEPMKKSTKVWTHDTLVQTLNLTGPSIYATSYETLNSDTILAGLKLLDERLNSLPLNMADQTAPGGGVTSGCLAQEEELCRKFALYVSINPTDNPHIKAQMSKNYLIPEHGCIYTSHIPVIRERKPDHFA